VPSHDYPKPATTSNGTADHAHCGRAKIAAVMKMDNTTTTPLEGTADSKDAKHAACAFASLPDEIIELYVSSSSGGILLIIFQYPFDMRPQFLCISCPAQSQLAKGITASSTLRPAAISMPILYHKPSNHRIASRRRRASETSKSIRA
jgi:hypothetical protein